MSSRLSNTPLSTTALLAALALCFTAPSQAQDELFAEDFEGATFCTWSASSIAETDCVSCVGKPDGTQCATPLIDCSGLGCTFDGPCDEFAPRDCPCITYSCSAGACVASPGSCPQPCVRNTNGTQCGGQGCPGGGFVPRCCNDGACSEICGVCPTPVAGAVDELRFEPARCEPAASDPLFATSARFAGFR